MNVFLWNARARNGHVEATLNHPFPAQVKLRSPGVANDTFCEAAKCDCPGQVNWHAGWKMQRFRGVHMALAYLDVFASAVADYRSALAGEKSEAPRATDYYAQQAASVSRGALAGAGRHSDCRALFCSQTFRCAMTWDPTVGASLVDVVRGGTGGAAAAKWALQHPNARVEAVTRKGQKNCHYRDAKRALVGTAASAWLDLDLPKVPAPGTIGFCGDFPEGAIHDLLRVKLNGVEIQDALEFWHGTQTLGVSAACYSTPLAARPDARADVAANNTLAFKVAPGVASISLTHVLWTEKPHFAQSFDGSLRPPAASTPLGRDSPSNPAPLRQGDRERRMERRAAALHQGRKFDKREALHVKNAAFSLQKARPLRETPASWLLDRVETPADLLAMSELYDEKGDFAASLFQNL